MLGNNEPKKASKHDEKDTLEGVQADIILETSLGNDA